MCPWVGWGTKPLSLGQVPGRQWEATRSHRDGTELLRCAPRRGHNLYDLWCSLKGDPVQGWPFLLKGAASVQQCCREEEQRAGFLLSLSPPLAPSSVMEEAVTPPAEAGTCLLMTVLITGA